MDPHWIQDPILLYPNRLHLPDVALWGVWLFSLALGLIVGMQAFRGRKRQMGRLVGKVALIALDEQRPGAFVYLASVGSCRRHGHVLTANGGMQAWY